MTPQALATKLKEAGTGDNKLAVVRQARSAQEAIGALMAAGYGVTAEKAAKIAGVDIGTVTAAAPVAELESLKRENEDLRAANAGLSNANEELTKKLEETAQQLEDAAKRIDELTNEAAGTGKKLDELDKANADLTKQNKELSGKLEKAEKAAKGNK